MKTNESIESLTSRVHELSRRVAAIDRPAGGWTGREHSVPEYAARDALHEEWRNAEALAKDIASGIESLKAAYKWTDAVRTSFETEIEQAGGSVPSQSEKIIFA